MQKSSVKERYEKILNEINRLEMLQNQYENEISKLTIEIEEKSKRIDELKNKRKDIEKSIRKIIRDNGPRSELAQEYKLITLVQPYFDINYLNTKWILFSRKTKTIDLMDNFDVSRDSYLVLSDALNESYVFSSISYIISKRYPQDSYIPTSLTITDLKKHLKYGALTDYFNQDPDENDRIYPLFKYIYEIYKEYQKLPYDDLFFIDLNYYGKAFRFEKAIGLGCQLSSDKYYRGNWDGINREYGETTQFYIVGCIVEDHYLSYANRAREKYGQDAE